MSARPMEGVKILEVAQFTYCPVAAACLADWGAEVIKIEHPVLGDGQRGFTFHPVGVKIGNFHPIMDHPNRGKRSIGLSLSEEAGLEILYELVGWADVFLTNFTPQARRRLKIDVDDVRAVNKDIIYVRASAYGPLGPTAETGGYDANSYWSRAGSSSLCTPPDATGAITQPGGAHGDSLGGLIIAGGISAALYSRAATGEPSVVDVSLLGVGAWATALSIDVSLLLGEPLSAPPMAQRNVPFNPIVGNYPTSDGRYINLNMLQMGRYWPDFCRVMDRQDLIVDPRFDSAERLAANAAEAATYVAHEIGSRTFEDCKERLSQVDAPWAPVANSLEVGYDADLRANGQIAKVLDADGIERELVVNPVLFDTTPASIKRAPLFAEHTDEVLRDLGRSEDEIMQLKIDGVVT